MRGSDNVAQGPWGQPSGHEQTPQFETFSPIDPAQWQDKDPPRREWMVEGCFPRGSVALVSGNGGVGKSLLVQQLCTCAVMGRSWLGLPVVAGRALYLACEDDADELWRRQAAINRSLDVEMDDLSDAGLALKPRVGQDNALMRLDKATWTMQATGLWRALERFCRDRGVQYVVLDPASHLFYGNERDARQVIDFIALLRRLAMAIAGVVIVTKHPSMAGRRDGSGMGGSTQWEDAVRTRLYVSRDSSDNLSLKGMKANYGKRLDSIPLVWRSGVLARYEAAAGPVNYYDPDA
jgi:RecA-family ATPase